MITFDMLRKRFQKFVYDDYSWKLVDHKLEISFSYRIVGNVAISSPVGENIPDGKNSHQAKNNPDHNQDNQLQFSPTLTINNVSQDMIDALGEEKINSYVFNIGLAEMFSYWKIAAPQVIEVNAGKLDQDQARWWHKLLIKGMGEYFFVNQIEFTANDFVKIISNSQKLHLVALAKEPTEASANEATKNSVSETSATSASETSAASANEPTTNSVNQLFGSKNSNLISIARQNIDKILIPIGGGKDSAVTLEILGKLTGNLEAIGTAGVLVVSPTQASLDIIEAFSASNQTEKIEVKRVIDPKLLELNQQGYLNGHVPISALFAFLSVFVADLFDYSHVAISNERSSNEGNVQFCNQEINHQYSKTFEFEQDFQKYVAGYLPDGAPLYFSFLRPLYELQIAKIFAGDIMTKPYETESDTKHPVSEMKKYHHLFRSCNRGQKTNSWCGKCSKCLFAYAILYPFMGDEIQNYFGKNLFEDENLWPIAQELLGFSEKKPLDCVGTHEETIVAFYLSTKKYLEKNQDLPVLLKKINQEIAKNEANLEDRTEKILNSWNKNNSVPTKLIKILKKYV